MPSAVVATRAWLADQREGVRFVTRTTDNLQAALPQCRIVGVGGPQTLNLGQQRIAVEAFAADELAAINLAHDVNDLLLYQMRGVIGDAVISKVRCYSLPARHDYTNPAVFMQIATYTVFIRPTY
jgi:hypothetical protein